MDHKEQASSAKNKYADWNTELQSKLREFREEKKSWITEAAALRSAEKEAQVCEYECHRRQLIYPNTGTICCSRKTVGRSHQRTLPAADAEKRDAAQNRPIARLRTTDRTARQDAETMVSDTIEPAEMIFEWPYKGRRFPEVQ